MPKDLFVPSVQVAAGAVPEGQIADFLTGRHVRDTPEEYVRQNLEKALVRQYRFAAGDCAPGFAIRVGSSRKRVDVAVFAEAAEHTEESIYLIVETKRAGTSPASRDHGVGQLQSYLAACLNARYGIWTNGEDKFAFAKRSRPRGDSVFEEIIDVPARGQSEAGCGATPPARSQASRCRQPAVRVPSLSQLHRRHRRQAESRGVLGVSEAHLLQNRGRALPPIGLLRNACGTY